MQNNTLLLTKITFDKPQSEVLKPTFDKSTLKAGIFKLLTNLSVIYNFTVNSIFHIKHGHQFIIIRFFKRSCISILNIFKFR